MIPALISPKRTAPILLAGLLAAALPAGDAPPKAGGPGKPLTPQEALKLFKLDEGLRIELVAAEPTIQSPVAMTFDPQGRIWVVEMQDYPNGPAKGENPRGRIRILEDKDGDGYYETASTFADNLLFANGLLLWKDGAIVTMAPHIVHLRDTDGDGKADRTDILYEGFAAQNPQLRVSHPILGLDGWVYCANGLRGGKAVKAGDPSAKPVDLSGMDFEFDPVTGAYEAITGLGQYGNTFDEWGNRFVCDNRHHLRHIVMEQRYLKRNPYLAAPALVEDVSVLDDGPLSSGGKVYPLSRNWTTSSLHEGRFTAACGVHIYHGGLLGKPYHGAAFTCEPTGNLVHMEVLTPKGATFASKPHRDKVEFLATPDDWFRPVFLTTGPDGALYIVDMYRAVIEHPEFMPPELQKRPDLALGRDRGRIWRIVPDKHVTKAIRPNLAKASIAELVKTLEHAEPWWRTTVQRLLLERNDKAMIESLRTLFAQTKSPHAKIVAAWMLERQAALTEDDVRDGLLRDEHPRVREHGIRLAEPQLEKNRCLRSLEVGGMLNRDRDPRVRFQTALSLGAFDTETAPLSLIAWKDHKDRWARLAVLSSTPKLATEVLWEFVDGLRPPEPGEPAIQAMIRDLAAITGAAEDLGGYWDDLQETKKLTGAVELVCFAGLAEGMERRGKGLVSSASTLPEQKRSAYLRRLESVFSEAGKNVRDGKQPLELRLTSMRILAQAPWLGAKQSLLPFVTDETAAELRIAALRSLASRPEKDIPPLLVKLWPSAGPAVRREILEAMLHRPERIAFLLDEIEANRVKASEIDASRTRQLTQHGDAKIRERSKKLLQDNLPGDRLEALKQYRAALDLKGDAKRGQEVFKKNCATCHKVAGVGIDVGPDIADTRTKTLVALLNDILVPNAAIDNNYVNYLVSTRDGRILTGMLAAETATSVTLRRAEGQTDVLLRKDIEEITSTGISLMPDGLEKNISVPEMADLLRFLKDWRYLDGSVPVNP